MTSLCDQELTCLCQCCDHQQSFSHFIYFVCAGLLIWKLKQQRQKDRQGTGLPQSDRSPSTCGHSVFCLMYQQEAGFEVEQLELEPGVQHVRPTLKAGADSEHHNIDTRIICFYFFIYDNWIFQWSLWFSLHPLSGSW